MHHALPIVVGLVAATTAVARPPLPAGKMVAADGAPKAQFGFAVAMDGDRVLVGAPLDMSHGSSSGAAYSYRLVDGAWVQEEKLVPHDGAPEDMFAISIGLSGDTAVIANGFDRDHGDHNGSAYVFQRTDDGWKETTELRAPDGEDRDFFGLAVAIDGDWIVAGASEDDDKGRSSGAAYVFHRQDGKWAFTQKLVASDGAEVSLFGWSVAIHGDVSVVGSFRHSGAADMAGAAYVFRRHGNRWAEEQKLVAADAVKGHFFGDAVAVHDDVIVAGAWGAGQAGAYVFRDVDGTWHQEQKIVPAGVGPNSAFSLRAVAVEGPQILVGALQDGQAGAFAGAAYLFRFDGEKWTDVGKILAAPNATGDLFGTAVALDDGNAVIGARKDDDKGEDAGAVYVYVPQDEDD